MDSDRWARVVELHHKALELPSVERGDFLRSQCGADEDLRLLLDQMLGDLPTDFVRPPILEAAPPQQDLEGQSLGDFQLHGVLGVGGMGTVYLASQGSLKREVALKVVRVGPGVTEDDLKRFEREAQRLATLDHRHIVPAHLAHRDGDTAYLAMPYLRGGSLVERLDRVSEGGELDLQESVHWMHSIARALDYVHAQGMQHRDVKPGNILLDEYGEAYLADFGIARQPEKDTITEQRGTLAYMSPEQVAERATDFRSDVYSLGVVLYELVTHARPFAEHAGQDLREAIIREQPPLMRAVRPGVPRDLETICQTAMAKSPEGRYPTAGAMALDLDLYLSSRPIMARPPTAWERAVHWLTRYRAGAAIGLALLLTAILAFSISRRLARQEAVDQVTLELQRAVAELGGEPATVDQVATDLQRAVHRLDTLRGLLGASDSAVLRLQGQLYGAAIPVLERQAELYSGILERSKLDPFGAPLARISDERLTLRQLELATEELGDVEPFTVASIVHARIRLRSHPPQAQVIALRLNPLTHQPEPDAEPIDLGLAAGAEDAASAGIFALDQGTYHFLFVLGDSLQGELIRPIYGANDLTEPPVVYLRPAADPGMVQIPACTLKVHRDERSRLAGEPTIALARFSADVTEVSNGDYLAFANAQGEEFPAMWPPFWGEPPASWSQRPVAWVNWSRAEAYCAWAGKRLPNYYEWSRLARGSDERESPWGGSTSDRDVVAQYATVPGRGRPSVPDAGLLFSRDKTNYEVRARAFLAYWTLTQNVHGPTGDVSPEGVLHLYGNVAEWTLSSALAGGVGVQAATPGWSTVRGGSWRPRPGGLETGQDAPMAAATDDIGFRGVKGPPPASLRLAGRVSERRTRPSSDSGR